MNKLNWKIFFSLLALTLVSIVFVFPYILSVQGELIGNAGVSVETIFWAQLAQSAILFSFLIFLGLRFCKKTGFRLPLFEAIFQKGDYRQVLKNIWPKSVLWGVGVAAAIYLADFLFIWAGAGISTHENYAPAWQKILASFYGGITEEVLMRLFLMSFFIWLLMKLFKMEKPRKIVIIFSIIIAAIVFGIGHLPITASLTEINTLVIARAIALNGIGGVVFGWLFWKKGLESSIIAHFTTDIFLLTIIPMIF